MKKLIMQFKWLIQKANPIKWLLVVNTLMNMVLSGISIYLALISKSLIDAATNGNIVLVFKWIKILAVIFMLQLLLRALVKYQHTFAVTKLLNDIQKKLFNHLLHSNWQAQISYHSMNLLGHIGNDAAKVTTLICDVFPSLITLSVTFLISFVTLLNLEPTIALITLLISPIFALHSLFIRKKMRQTYHETQEQEIKYNAFMQENLQNISIVKSFCHERMSMMDFDILQEKRFNLNLHTCKLNIKADTLLSIGSTLTYFFIFSFTAYELACHKLSFGTLAALLQLYRNVQTPLSNLAGSLTSIIQGLVSVDRLIEIEQISEEPLGLPTEMNHFEYLGFKGLRFNKVNFAYIMNQLVLEDINLEIKAGEIIGLMGQSGSGKTTLIRLLLALLTPLQGEITFEMQEQTMKLMTSHRHLMSYVPQGNTLFSGTIEENITYGNAHASFEQIKEAAVLAAAWPFINSLKEGLKTSVGEKNKGLSEGQAQRIAIARALLCKKPILILDEATSALDATTERTILKHLKNWESCPTCIIITHRHAALDICDHVYEITNGHIIENKNLNII
nr:ABC transporter ATP-binding protein [uncultured Cellulosilyticum sp.]